MRSKIKLIAISLILFCSTANAENLVWHKQLWNEYASNVQSYTDVYVYDTKRVFFHTKFSNGNKHHPQDMMVYVKLVRPDGSWFVKTEHHVHRLQPSFGGRAREHVVHGEVTLDFPLPSEIKVDIEFSTITPEMAAYSQKLLDDFIKRGQPQR